MMRLAIIICFFFLQNFAVLSQNEYWKNLDGLYGGLTNSVQMNNGNIYCAGFGGVYGSSDNGNNWECIGLRNQTLNGIRIVANYLFAVSVNGCFRCRLHDTTWTKVTETPLRSIIANDSILFSYGENFGLYRSTDLGDNWSRVDQNFDNSILQIFITSNNTILASLCCGSGVYRSTDMGENWSRTDTGDSAWNFEGFAEYNKTLYGFNLTNYAKVYLSTDFGQTWFLPANAASPSDIILTIYADKSGLYSGVYRFGFFRSTDEGVNWTTNNNALANKNIFSINGDSLQLFAGTYDGIYRYSKAYAKWSKKSKGLNNSWITSLSEINDNLLVGTYGSGLFIRDSTGFRKINLGNDYLYVSDIIVSSRLIYVVAGKDFSDDYYTKLFISNNRGNTWSQDQYISGIKSIALNGKYIFGGSYFGVYRKNLQSTGWEKLTNGIPENINAADIACSDSVVIVTWGTSQIYRSTDNGDSWQNLTVQDLFAGDKIVSYRPGEFYLGSDDVDMLFKSTDYGLTWQLLNNPLSNSNVQAIFAKDNEVFVGSSKDGISTSKDSGVNWERTNTGLTSMSITCFTNIGDEIYAGSKLNGIYKRINGIIPSPDTTQSLINVLSDSVFYNNKQITLIWSSSKITNLYHLQFAYDSLFTRLLIDDQNICDTSYTVGSLEYNNFYYWRISPITLTYDNHFSAAQKIRIDYPTNFSLYNNYPNPFNNTTTIKFNVPKQSLIKLELFDILGQRVRILLNEEKEPGEHKYTLSDKYLASGIYIVRLSSVGFSQAIKIVLLK